MTTPTTLTLTGSDMLYLNTCLLHGVHVLNELAFATHTQNYWLARITPPDMSQRQDAYRRPRSFQRRYLQVVDGGSRVQFDTHDFAYGFAYEFGGDTVTSDRRIPARIYCVYLGTNGTGTVAEFRIYPSAEVAMEAEQYMARHPQMAMAYNSSMKLDDPAPGTSTSPKPKHTPIAAVPAVDAYMKLMYAEMVKNLSCIHWLEKRLREAGYEPQVPEPESKLFIDARAAGESDGALLWKQGIREAIALVEADAIASKALAAVDAEKAARKPQDAPVPAAAPVAQPVTTSPVAPPAGLLDAIVDEQSPATAPAPAPAPAPVNRLTQESDVLAAAAAAKPARRRRTTTATGRTPSVPALQNLPVTRRPRPANVPPTSDPNCPF